MHSSVIDIDGIAVACRDLVPTADHAELVKAASAATGLDFKLAYVDDGWFRMGGVVDGHGRRLSDDIEDWVLGETGGDMVELFNRYADAGLRFTRVTGRRLYLTVATGPAPLDFLQVEIDQVQEMLCRPVFDGDTIPDTVEQLAVLPPWKDATPLGQAHYVYRRVTRFTDMPELVAEHTGDLRLKRFIEEWSASSAGAASHFSEHWVLRVVPYRNSDGEHVLEAVPLSAAAVSVPDLADAREHDVDYNPARVLAAVDRDAGYRMAWYFLQIARHFAPYRVVVDARDGFNACKGGVAALPDKDAAILDRWVAEPYNFH
jgi:hypothetical protein